VCTLPKSIDLNQDFQPKNVHVHNTNPFVDPAYIPYSNPYTEKIASLAIDVIREFDLQIIDSWYILPYVVSGYITKTITGKPQIMRHAGSDMSRLLDSPYLKTLFFSIFNKVDKVITYPAMGKVFESYGVPKERLWYNLNISVDTEAFSPEVKPINLSKQTVKAIDDDIPVITYIGKMNTVKGVYELVESASKIKEDFLLLFVTQNTGLTSFQEFIRSRGMEEKSLFMNFVPPWKIPSIIKRSSCVVIPERDFPVAQHTSILSREVLAAGGCLILSKELYDKMRWVGFSENEDILVVDPKNIPEFQTTLEMVLNEQKFRESIKRRARLLSEKVEHFEQYINDITQLYNELLS